MAFTKTVSRRFMAAGELIEEGSWVLSGGDTAGTIVPATSGQGIAAGIREITDFSLASDTNSPDLVGNLNGAGAASNRAELIVTSAANDTGFYTIKGYPA